MGTHPVPKDQFFVVLVKNGFTIEHRDDGSFRIAREGTAPEIHYITGDTVARRLVMRFAHKYKIPRLEFWPSSLKTVAHSDE
ncbi:MAG TPA: hypothetical protein VLV78_03335 [Thermoanaerobaculia bacterium]|nr:hypothetical protein [Thermoanaerobaculia bacterium]